MDELASILVLSTLAGLATGIGGLVAIFRRPGKGLLGFLLGFASGIMVVLAFLELVSKAWLLSGPLVTTLGFATGALFMFLLDHFLPHKFFEAEGRGMEAKWSHRRERFGLHENLFRSGVLIATGIFIHNVPEGMAVAAGYSHAPQFGTLVAIAVARHNMPEGIAVSVPAYASGASKLTALRLAFISGLAEPLGALLAALFLEAFRELVPLSLAFAGGVMTFITMDELVPIAHRHGHEHSTCLGMIAGCIVMFLLLGFLTP